MPNVKTAASVPGFVVLYRWRLRAGKEASFVAAWTKNTEVLRECGSLGSRLHKGDDEIWYGYAQWPSAQARTVAFSSGKLDETASRQMREGIEEALPEIVLFPVIDLLSYPV